MAYNNDNGSYGTWTIKDNTASCFNRPEVPM